MKPKFLNNGGLNFLHEYDVESFQNDGYLLLKGFIHKATISQILFETRDLFLAALDYHKITSAKPSHEELDGLLYQLFEQHPETFINCAKHAQHLFGLWELACSRNLRTVMTDLGLELPNICTRPVFFFNNPKLAKDPIYHTVPAHQDWASMKGSQDSVVIWVPLGNVPKELGALEVVPGSHKEGLIVDRYEHGFGLVDRYSDDDFISVETEAGDALVFSSYLVHRSGKNITDRVRWSCHFRYNNMKHPEYGGRSFNQNYIYMPKSKVE